jgi:serine/threonine protein phosphatase PrpC
MTSFRWGSSTDTGRVRSVNQDNSLVVGDRLFALADGMGGHQGGEVASEVALTVLGRHLTEYSMGHVLDAVREANRQVFTRAGADPDLTGMGTTLCALALVDDGERERLALVNVGDSRVYRQRGDELEQLTDDHSLVASLVREGRLTLDEAAIHPQRNVLTRALGIDSYVQIDSWQLDAVTGDRFLLCSDGLFNEVEETKIGSTLRRFGDPTDAARELVRLANEGGGRDNITCVVVEVTEGPGAAHRPPMPSMHTDVHKAIPAVAAAAGDAGPDGEADSDDAPVEPGPEELNVDETELGVVDLDDEDDSAPSDGASPTPRRFTWRVLLFGLALVGLLAATAGAVAWYGRNTYFVAFDADEVVIFKGRPGGVLWLDPTEEERTGIDRRDVPPGVEASIEEGRDQATLEDALNFVANLADQIDEVTSTTTTTTAPPRGGAP